MRNETERVGLGPAQGSALVDLVVVLELIMEDLGVVPGVPIGVVFAERLCPPTRGALSNAEVEEKVKT